MKRLAFVLLPLLLALGAECKTVTLSEVYNGISLLESCSEITVSEVYCQNRYVERDDEEFFRDLSFSATLEAGKSANFQIGFALFEDESLVEILGSGSQELAADEKITFETEINLRTNLPQGKYKIYAVCKSEEEENWHCAKGFNKYYMDLTIDENSALIQPMPKTWRNSTIFYGIHLIDGVAYNIRLDGAPQAIPVLLDNAKYQGDLTIPNYVDFKGQKFYVYPFENVVFTNSPGLTSLSFASRDVPYIYGNKNLENLFLNEGVTNFNGIADSDLIESVIFPSTCDVIYFNDIKGTGIKSLAFNNAVQTKFIVNRTPDFSNLPNLADIYFKSDYPAEFSGWTEPLGNVERITVHIPTGTKEIYLNSIWKNFNLVEDQPEIPIRIEWDYCGKKEEWTGGVAFGNGDDDVEIAIEIPAASLKPYIGSQITELEYYINGDDMTEWKTPEYLFLTNSEVDYISKQSFSSISQKKWNVIRLANPYTITGEDIFVGVGSHGVISVDFPSQEFLDGRIWQRVMGDDYGGLWPGCWYCMERVFQHPVWIRAIIQGNNLPSDIIVDTSIEGIDSLEAPKRKPDLAKSPEASEDSQYFCKPLEAEAPSKANSPARAETNEPASNDSPSLKVTMRSRTPRMVRNVELNLNIDGIDFGKRNIETILPTNHEVVSYIELPTKISGRSHTLNVDVNSIDGEPDAVPDNSCRQLNYYYIDNVKYFPRKIVLEEAAGTWCGWCPSQILLSEQLKEYCPGNFIIISCHDDTEMLPADHSYDNLFDIVYSFPVVHINRTRMEEDGFDAYQGMDFAHAAATISAEAAFTDANTITVKTNSTFGFSDDGSTEYRIAYVLLEDNVGPYWQRNFYSDPNAEDNPEDPMNWWNHQDSYVETTFNDVARKIYDYDGTPGLLPMQITQGETYAAEYALTLPDNLQDTKNLRMVTLLLDTRSGEILNADCAPVTNYELSTIRTVTFPDAGRPRIYNLQGQPVADGYKGLVIKNGKKMLRK